MKPKAKESLRETGTANLAGRDAASCGCKWIRSIGPSEIVEIAENAPRVLMVLENLGAGPVVLATGNRREEEILPDEIKVLEAYGTIAIRNKEQFAASVAMQFTPRAK
jgi:hypothetical protein